MPIDPRNIEVLDDEMAAIFRAMTGAQRLTGSFNLLARQQIRDGNRRL